MHPFADLPLARRPREYRLVREADGRRVRLWFTLLGDSGWFDGHFPHRPVLPGVTQVHLAALAGQRLFGPLQVVGSRRLKFLGPVSPGAALELDLVADGQARSGTGTEPDATPTRIRFSFTADGEPASSGTFAVRAITGATSGRQADGAAD